MFVIKIITGGFQNIKTPFQLCLMMSEVGQGGRCSTSTSTWWRLYTVAPT